VPKDNQKPVVTESKPFVTDVKELRRRARQHMEQGAVTEGYRADRATVMRILNEALATELVCVLRYKRHYYMAPGIHSGAVVDEFLEHAQNDGEPDLNPETLTARSHSEYIEGEGLIAMIREDLVAERIVIQSYSEMIRYLGDDDPSTRRMLEEILAQEEDHANELQTLLERYGPDNDERGAR
jgi:bacterioferritin